MKELKNLTNEQLEELYTNTFYEKEDMLDITNLQENEDNDDYQMQLDALWSKLELMKLEFKRRNSLVPSL